MTFTLGGTIGAMILSGIISLCFAWKFADVTSQTTMTILDWSGSAFDHIVSFWQKDVWPSIKKRTSAFIEWIKGKKENKQLVATTVCEQQPVIIKQS